MTRSATETPSASPPSQFLKANDSAYQHLLAQLNRVSTRPGLGRVLSDVAIAAQFAATFHAGRFADGAAENIAFEIGAGLGTRTASSGPSLPSFRKPRLRRVLQVASHVANIGGHTRMLNHWVQQDSASCHSLVLLDQPGGTVPDWLEGTLASGGGSLVTLPSGWDVTQRARWLRRAAREGADLVVLHHGAWDVIPTLAFSTGDCPPIAILNHADHQFWLGSTIADIVINLRTAGGDHTAKRRYVSSNAVIPIPLVDTGTRSEQSSARRSLGIPDEQIVLLSVGRPEKYRPCGVYDFVATAGRILELDPRAHLYVVGETASGIVPYLRGQMHERLHFVGSVEQPGIYRQAADVYIESFPFGSQTALLEAALYGLPVVPAYAPLFPLLVANDDALVDLIPNPPDEQSYVTRVGELMTNSALRRDFGSLLRARLLVDHVGDGWAGRLLSLYRQTDGLKHTPRPIDVSACQLTRADIGLSLWHVAADGRTYGTATDVNEALSLERHTAFVAKEAGDYRTARRHARRALLINPLGLPSWRLFAITQFGPFAKLMRRQFNQLKVRVSPSA